MEKRKLDIAVLSDLHLGAYGCRAKEICRYLSTIDPAMLILNGDIIDAMQLPKQYWPKTHMQVVKQITSMLARGVKVYYITGNHDKAMRRFEHFTIGDFHIVHKLILHHNNGEKSWIFHGDTFDAIREHTRWLTRLGTIGYALLNSLNGIQNFFRIRTSKESPSVSKKLKRSARFAEKYILPFKKTVCELAAHKNYRYVICGHLHRPEITEFNTKKGSVLYLNAGDWIENLTALEFRNHHWTLYEYAKDQTVHAYSDAYYQDEAAYMRTSEIFNMMMEELHSIHESTDRLHTA